jgi:hypothetical protein
VYIVCIVYGYCTATVQESSIMVVCYCVTKLSVRLGHDNMIPAKGGHQGGDILSYRTSGERKEPTQ